MNQQHEQIRCSVICPGFGVSSETWMYRQIVGMNRLAVQVLTWRRENEQEYTAPDIPVCLGPTSSTTGKAGRLFRRVSNNFRGVGPFDGAGAEAQWLKQRLQGPAQQVVLAHYGTTAARIAPLCRALKVPMVAHFNGFDASKMFQVPWYRAQLARNIESISAFVVVATYMKDALIGLGACEDKIHLIPYGAPMAELQVASNVGSTPCRIIMVGRLVEKKRPDLSIRAFASCVARFSDCELVIIGDGPMLEECKALADSLGISDKLRWLGAMPNERVRAELAASSVFVQHSVTASTGDKEGWPVAIAEAAGTGLPVVSTRHAGIVDQIEDGVNGYLVDEGDCEKMADRMVTLAEDAELRARMGASARERMLELDTANQIPQLEEVLLNAAKQVV